MSAVLPHKDFVPPSDVNTNALAFDCTSRRFTSNIDMPSSCNTLFCCDVYIPWLRDTLQELRTCSVGCLPWHSGHVVVTVHFPPHQICI
ncbi:hypothetical protein PoB_007284100 [Plakobranchus ocellatus]|uniref:Uncharacterized protein n=1 Tax=Plakobranchus ocellatus TaxID=259542 RepID=A0AAV4DR46_9GAST|nr:hypothetical protein PoB_007284100 [Plakobranchus ocellatus]